MDLIKTLAVPIAIIVIASGWYSRHQLETLWLKLKGHSLRAKNRKLEKDWIDITNPFR